MPKKEGINRFLVNFSNLWENQPLKFLTLYGCIGNFFTKPVITQKLIEVFLFYKKSYGIYYKLWINANVIFVKIKCWNPLCP